LLRPAQHLAAQSKRLAVAFAVVFFFSVAAYTAASAALRSTAAEVRTSALEIVNSSGLSVDLLASMRTRLRRREVLLYEFTERAVAERGGAAGLQPMVASEGQYRALMEDDWDRYLGTSLSPGEREVQPMVGASLLQVDVLTDRAIAAVSAGDARGAQRLFEGQIKPTLDALDLGLKSLQTINTLETWRLSRKIVDADRRAGLLALVFGVVCGVLSAGAALLALLLVRQHARSAVRLVSELELFSSRIAHDLRGPLGSARLSVDLAARDPALGSEARKRLARTGRTLRDTADILDGLLSLAGMIAGSEARQERADAKAVLEGVRDELLPDARERGIELFAAEGPDCEVACSPGVLASIARNLLGNAIKHMGDARVRRVSMRVRAEGAKDRARIEVSDSGPGIPPSLQPRLFTPYARIARPEVSGLGLGLATVQRLAALLGGRVGLESREGAGSTFWVELPRAAASGAPG
jgi:signal transduction histidine kinase